MSGNGSVRVLVIPSVAFDRLGRFQGFCGEVDRYLDTLLSPDLLEFRPRSEVEDDPSYKQLIPYVIFQAGNLIFHYRRGTSQGESRLHRLRSIGVGGHVDEADADGRNTPDAYDMALRRELAEEVAINSPGTLSRIGLINDDATPVGQVHLGVVHLYRLDRADVVPLEEGLADSGFASLDLLKEDRDSFETWSRFCLDALAPI